MLLTFLLLSKREEGKKRMNFHAILSFSVLSSFSENERENGQFSIFLSFSDIFQKEIRERGNGERAIFPLMHADRMVIRGR